MSVRDGAQLGAARLRESGTALACLLALGFELGVALLERAQGRLGAADRALTGGAFGLALPLLCYFLVARVCAGKDLREAVLPLARHGMDRLTLVLGLALPAALVAALFGGSSGAAVVMLTRGFSDAALAGDVATSFWIGLVAGPIYVAMLTGASSFGLHGRGRVWLLAADFLLGSSSSLLALPWPKGHVRNLLGGEPVLSLSQVAALLILLGTGFASLWFGAQRNER